MLIEHLKSTGQKRGRVKTNSLLSDPRRLSACKWLRGLDTPNATRSLKPTGSTYKPVLEEDLESSEIESLPLEPGRRDVVRLMNLHKVKGLAATVVCLADPLGGVKERAD